MKHFYTLLAAAMVLIPFCAYADLYGNIPNEGTLVGIPTDGSQTLEDIYTNEEYMVANGGGVWADGTYYVVYLDDDNPYIVYSCLSAFLFEDGVVSRKSTKTFYDEEMYTANDMTCDEISRKVYGVFRYYDEGVPFFGTLNTVNGRLTRIADNLDWCAIACDATGRLYAFGKEGTLYNVDSATGAAVPIGSTGLISSGKASATIDAASGVCYLSITPEGGVSSLYTVDLTTAEATLVSHFAGGKEVTGLFTISSNVNAAPAPVTGLTADFAGESLSGTVSFTTPVTLANGTPTSGAITYTLAANGELLASEETVCGNLVEVPVQLAEAGEYTFEVKVSNSSAVSEPATVTRWVGPDTRPSLVPPFEASFASAADLADYTIIDANNDTKIWNYYNNRVRISYNANKPMDDWLISPRVEMKQGMLYRFEINFSTSSLPERFEVKMGATPTAEGMTIAVIAPTDLETEYNTPERFTADVIVPADGYYYIGIHAISDEDTDALYLHGFSLSAPTPLDNPAAPQLTVTADPSFALSAEVSVTAPTGGINGSVIETLDKIEVTRDGTLIKTFDNPAPGETYRFTDSEGLAIGDHTYTATAFARGQAGATAETIIYIGVAIPSSPDNADFVQIEPGKVCITWDAPTTDEFGREINPEMLTYKVMEVVDDKVTTIAEGVTELSYTYDACAPDAEQNLYYYGIVAVSEAGESSYCITDHKAVGAYYVLPFAESFAGGELSHVFGTNRLEGVSATWRVILADSDNPAQDGDGGLVSMIGSYPGERVLLSSGNIDLSGTVNPTLSFWYYSLGSDCTNTLAVLIDDGGGYVVEQSHTLNAPAGWTRIEVPLAEYYTDRVVRFALDGTIVSHTTISVDNIRLEDIPGSVSTVAADEVLVRAADGAIVITAAEPVPVTVCDSAGRVVYVGEPTESCRVPVAPGVYVVRAAGAAYRVMVK